MGDVDKMEDYRDDAEAAGVGDYLHDEKAANETAAAKELRHAFLEGVPAICTMYNERGHFVHEGRYSSTRSMFVFRYGRNESWHVYHITAFDGHKLVLGENRVLGEIHLKLNS